MNSEATKPARVLYKELFAEAALRKLYDEKIFASGAVGRDGIGQKQFEDRLADEINIILRKVAACSYHFTTYRERLISKGPHKPPRVISIPTIRDRLALRVVNDILSEVFVDARIFRPHVYIKEIKKRFETQRNDLAFVRIDVQDFYPSIDHGILLKKVRRRVRKTQLVHLIRAAIQTPTGNSDPSGKGVPQGLSISNILSSIYLEKLDHKFKEKYAYFRYVDDILVICNFSAAGAIFKEIKGALRALRLTCHPLGKAGKSEIREARAGIEYLGFRLTPTKISVRPSSYTRMIENLLGVLTQYKHASERMKNEDKLVWRLNLKITGCIFNSNRFGWMFFFAQIDDIRQLARLDNFVTKELRMRGLEHLRAKVKRFTRSWHEICLNFRETRYIPKFDQMSIDDMIKELSNAEGFSDAHYRSNYTEQEIRTKFTRLICHETRLLEKDLIEAIS